MNKQLFLCIVSILLLVFGVGMLGGVAIYSAKKTSNSLNGTTYFVIQDSGARGISSEGPITTYLTVKMSESGAKIAKSANECNLLFKLCKPIEKDSEEGSIRVELTDTNGSLLMASTCVDDEDLRYQLNRVINAYIQTNAVKQTPVGQ